MRAAWVLLTGLVAGCSIWATHFIAMLAFEPNLPSAYAALSMLIGTVTLARAVATPDVAAAMAKSAECALLGSAAGG